MKSSDPNLRKLHINEPLQGDLDLGFLGENALITEIVFAPGKGDRMITGLKHLPKKLVKLVCTKNQLTELNDLPASLEELEVSHNKLSKIDFSRTPGLKKFHGSHNQLYILESLPASLEEMNVSHNQLSKINLLGLTQLRVLDCTMNNHPLVLENYPHTNEKSIQLKMDTDALTTAKISGGANGSDDEDDSDEDQNQPKTKTKSTSKITYIDALNQYFALKTKYEDSVKKIKEKSKTVEKTSKKKITKDRLPPCIQCHANVGMTFTKNGSTYHTHCGIGNRRNCPFEIELYAGIYENFDDLVEHTRKNFEIEKQELIQQKMETLFGWIDEKTSAKKFKERLDTYVQNNLYIDILMNQYRELHASTSRQELTDRQIHKIAEIKIQIQEMLKEYQADPLNKELLQNAMEVHVQELMPEVEKLQKLRHKIQEVNPVYEMTEGFMGQQKLQMTGYALYQRPNTLDTMDYEHDAPKVIKYVRS